MEHRGLPVVFHQHAFDGAAAEGLTEWDAHDALVHGKETRRARGRIQVEHARGKKVVIVRYAEREHDNFVFSVSQRARR